MADIRVQKKSREELEKMGVFDWPIWEKEISTFNWHYDIGEQGYIIEGKVRIEPAGGEPVEFGTGDFVQFPAGMDCVWKITSPVRKHYRLD